MQTVFCDECGFTGNHLLDAQQPHFAYAAVALEPDEASLLVKDIVGRHDLQSSEIKGSRLLRSSPGRKALAEIFERLSNCSRVAVFEKKYALACKLFEYVFEPALAANNALFYSLNFHRFIANMLYLHFRAGAQHAEAIFEHFEHMVRSAALDRPGRLLSPIILPDMSPILQGITRFAWLNRASIQQELDGLVGAGLTKWTLDLTTTALYGILADIGERHEIIRVVCDESKPLQDEALVFDTMIGRRDKFYSWVPGREQRPMTFNLSGPIQLAASATTPGIQLADAMAAGSVYALSGNDKTAAQWRAAYLPRILSPQSVLPDSKHIDPQALEAQRNALLLIELVERSAARRDLLEGMAAHAARVTALLAEKLYHPSRWLGG